MTFDKVAELRRVRNRAIVATSGISDTSLRWLIASQLMQRLWLDCGRELAHW